MQEKSDAQLLAAFAGHGDESAFREIVTRYTDLVYSAALRQVESSAAAADITQGVFTDLARKAGTLARPGSPPLPVLAGWLHRATRYAALNHLRDARRRLANERQAMEQLLTNTSAPDVAWPQIRPALDEALDNLGDEDREAILHRYFKNQDFRAIGLVLGISDDAAQKRVSRAVERLREFFNKRDITISASALAVLISANAIQSAPAGLAAAISTTALLTGAAITTTTTSTVTITKALAMTTLQKTIITVAVVAIAGAGAYQIQKNAKAHTGTHESPPPPPQPIEQTANVPGPADGDSNTMSALNQPANTNPAAMVKPDAQQIAGQTATQTSSPSVVPPTNTPVASLEFPRDSWTNAGFATPEAALKTRGWSVLTGNREVFAQSLSITPGARKMLEDMFVQMAQASTDPSRNQTIRAAIDNKWGVEEAFLMPMMAQNEKQGFAGYRVISEDATAPDQMTLNVETEMTSGNPHTDTLKLQRFDNDWKVVIDEDWLKSMH